MASRIVAVTVVVAGLLVGCTSGAGGVHTTWTRVLVPTAGTPEVEAVLAGDAGHPWLVGGATARADGTLSVAIWSAGSAAGPWQADHLTAVSGDGPEDTITGLASDGATTVAFGSRPSPIHGNPRPSPWVLAEPSAALWREVPTVRELFGGENIVALGGLAGGPHGFTIAGTWINPANRSVATVWRSVDGEGWARNDTDPALGGLPGEYTSATDVADSTAGLAVVGSALLPTPADPGAERGALWAGDGSTWSRVDATDLSLDAPGGQVRVERVAALADGWVAIGTRHTATGSALVVWTWRAGQRPTATELRTAGPATATGLAVSATAVAVAAVADGRPVVWTASVGKGGRLGGWRPAGLPPGSPPAPSPGPLDRVLVALGGGSLLLVEQGRTGSQLWAGTLG